MPTRCLFTILLACILAALGGCRTMNDVLSDKSSGVARIYPVNTEKAWDLSRTVFRWEGTDAIEEHKSEGYMLTSSGINLVTYGTLMAAWIEPAPNDSTKVTVLTKRRVATNIITTLTEDDFHRRFAQAVKLSASGVPLPIKPPPLSETNGDWKQ